MKISSSSSMLFALAISASSSSLAAPAGDLPNSEAAMTSSPSGHHAARRDSTAGRGLRPSNMQQAIETARAIDTDQLEARRGLLDPLRLNDILCPLTGLLVTCPAPSGKQALMSAESSPSMSTAQARHVLWQALAALSNDEDDNDNGDNERKDEDDDGDDDAEPDPLNNESWSSTGSDGESSGGSNDDPTPQDSNAPAADYNSASATPSLPGNPPDSPDVSSTTAPTQPTDTPARRDALPVSATSSLPVPPLMMSNVPVALPTGLSQVAARELPSVGNINVVARFPLRRWMARAPQAPAQAPALVPPVVIGVAGGAPVGVLSTATSEVLGTAPTPVAMNIETVAGEVGGAAGAGTVANVVEGGLQTDAKDAAAGGTAGAPSTGTATNVVEGVTGDVKGAAPAIIGPAANTGGSDAGKGVGTVGVIAGGVAPAPAQSGAATGAGVAGSVASDA